MPPVLSLKQKMMKSNAYAITVKAPSGTMSVIISEDDEGNPNMVQIFLGKTGSTVFALLNAIADLISSRLEAEKNVDGVIVSLSNFTSDRLIYSKNIPIRSDVDAIVYALTVYKKEKYKEVHPRVERKRRILNQ